MFFAPDRKFNPFIYLSLIFFHHSLLITFNALTAWTLKLREIFIFIISYYLLSWIQSWLYINHWHRKWFSNSIRGPPFSVVGIGLHACRRCTWNWQGYRCWRVVWSATYEFSSLNRFCFSSLPCITRTQGKGKQRRINMRKWTVTQKRDHKTRPWI